MSIYLDLARQGKNDWWRYLAALLLILFLWQMIGAIPGVMLFVWVLMDGNPQTDVATSGAVGVDPVLNFVVFMVASVLFLAGIYLAVRFIHQRRFLTLITPAPAIAWGRLVQGFITWFLLAGLTGLLEARLYPGRYVWTLDLDHFIPFFFLALVLIPIQTSAEELFFRGYLVQGIGLRIRNIWVLSAISGLLFMFPHLLNPEAAVNWTLMALYYFSFGAFMAYLSLRDGRLELALGIHAANNLFSAIVANYTTTVLPTPSLFTVTVLDAVYSVLAALVTMGVFILLFSGPLRRKVTTDGEGEG